MAMKMAAVLQLTDDQAQKVTQINLKFIQKLDAARHEQNKQKKERDIQAVMEERASGLKKVLTSEQWKAYQQLKS